MLLNYREQCRLIDKEVIMSSCYLKCDNNIIAGVGDKVTIYYKYNYPSVTGVIEHITDKYIFLNTSISEFNIKIRRDIIDKVKYICTVHGDDAILTPNEVREKIGLDPIPDNVNHPSHYKSETGLEAIDAIEAFTFDLKGIEAVDTGNVLKYICRWKKKNGLEDLKKAQWYLNHLIKHVENLEKENELP